MELEQPPSKPVFAWDNGVILQQDLGKAFACALKFPRKIEVITSIKSWRLIAWWLKQCIIKRVIDDKMVEYAQKHGNDALAEFIISVSCQQKTIKQTVELVKKLHELGYRNVICSNICQPAFEYLTQHTAHAEFLNTYFDHDRSQFPFKHESPQHAALPVNNGNGLIKKPSYAFYMSLLRKNNLIHNPSGLVVIDDRVSNTEGAKKLQSSDCLDPDNRITTCLFTDGSDLIQQIEAHLPHNHVDQLKQVLKSAVRKEVADYSALGLKKSVVIACYVMAIAAAISFFATH